MMVYRILFAFLFVAFGTALTAQCGSHHNKSKAVNASWSGDRQDIIDIAAGSDDFSTLVTAVKTAGLVKTLQGEGPFTVFAPVNAAFAKLPEGTVKTLLQPENKATLTKILTYHVIAGEFKARDVVNAIKASGGEFSIKTVSGDILKASLRNGSVILKDEKGGVSAVTQTDVDASNGVIHIIDTVVIPD
ncbi:MAG: fasciclin domain-containing protein [Bacteroidota bacterium]